MTIALYVTEEMCARMGVITGKGLSDLIREEFGFRSTFFVMITGFLVDLGNVVAEFAGVAAAMQIFGISKYIAVPIAAILVWVLVLKGNYRQVEVVFLVACVFYLDLSLFSPLRSSGLAPRRAHDRCPQHPFRHRLSHHPHRFSRNHHCAMAIFLSSSRLRRKKGRPAPISSGQARRSFWQHLLHGHRFLHHHLHCRHTPRFRSHQYHRRCRSCQSSHPSGREVGRHYFRLWTPQRLTLCCHHPSALHCSRHL